MGACASLIPLEKDIGGLPDVSRVVSTITSSIISPYRILEYNHQNYQTCGLHCSIEAASHLCSPALCKG